MKYLLDSHILIWALTSDEKMSEETYKIIDDPSNEIFYSTASVWEIEIKHAKRPEQMPISGSQLISYCDSSFFYPLPIKNFHVLALRSLSRCESAPAHHDPFDRIILAQAKAEQMTFITHDGLLRYYDEPCIKLV